MAAHGSLEPFVLVRVQVGELETGPRGEAGAQIHLIHIQWHDERARSDCAMRPVFVVVRLTLLTRTGRSGKLTTGNINPCMMHGLIFRARFDEVVRH